ncbi:MAG: endo-1,4-beta-xylanase [Clostridia bacterium]|nr:endo-1,4-beta-xylanase [Clostridia bacterium]
MHDRKKVLDLFDEQEDFWKQKATDGIEQYRKGNGRITVADKEGKPVSNAKIKLTQKSHEFRFGANIFMLDELESEEKNEKYKKYFSDIFNMATLPFYWDTLEPERGNPRYAKNSPKVYRRPSPDLCIEFCEKHKIEPREHALAYDAFFPKWLYDAGTEEVKRELERRYAEIAELYADKIRTIEVTNEMGWKKGKTKFYDEPDFVEWCFKLAEKYFPNNQLVINEGTDAAWGDGCRATDKYYAYTEANMLKGVRIDAIGMQYHLFNKAELEYENTRLTLNPECLYKHMDLYSNFGKPLQITEVTVPAYSWKAEDEEIQAEIIEKLYSIWFSHPNVEQIIYWNLVDGYAHFWDPDPEKIKASQGDMTLGENYYYGGLLRFDLSPKPAYFRIKDLLRKKWHTETELVTDGNGSAEFRGFYGDYCANVEFGGQEVKTEFSLSKNAENSICITL